MCIIQFDIDLANIIIVMLAYTTSQIKVYN